jgi:dTDP-4-amino-4,6-dideoxygalactose transaminase
VTGNPTHYTSDLPLVAQSIIFAMREHWVRKHFLPFSPPSIGDEEIAEVVDTLRSGWLTTGPKTRLFEQQFAAAFDSPGAIALNSCTAGLHTALTVLGIGPGDEVITTCLTFAATVNVIEHVGATPVLVDVEADTLNLDPRAVARAITPRTKAVIVVHFAGHPANLAALGDLATEHSLAIVEDAAHAVGAKHQDAWIGSSENLTAFSFYATKNLVTGEGGMLTGPPELLAKARVFSLHGMSREAWRRYERGGSWRYDVVAPGFKYNMTDMQAALGIVQLRRFAHFQSRREQIARQYEAAFRDWDALQLPVARPDVVHAWHLYPLRLRTEQLRIGRDQMVDELASRNIGTSVHFIPIHVHPYYRTRLGHAPEDFPTAWDAFGRMLSLPLNPSMTDCDVADVIEAVTDLVQAHARVSEVA